MRHKGLVIFLATIVSLLCVYYLSFTFVSANLQRKATIHATDEENNVDYIKRQAYLNDLMQKPVYNFFGKKYTYEEVKDKELSLGLDLIGGLHVTLEISPVQLIKGLAGNRRDEAFLPALKEAGKLQKKRPQEAFVDLFYEAYQTLKPEGRLSDIFANSNNRSKINHKSTNQEVLNMLRSEINESVERCFNIIRVRIDGLGTKSANIQRLPGSGRIQVELPGVHAAKRVKKLLQGVAKLSFWEVYDTQKALEVLQNIDKVLVQEQKLKAEKEKIAKAKLEKADAKTNAAAQETPKETTEEEEEAPVDQSPIFSKLRTITNGLVYEAADKDEIAAIFKRPDIKRMLPKDLSLTWEVKATKQGRMKVLTLYPLKTSKRGKAILEGEVIMKAEQSLDRYGRPSVVMYMNGPGTRAWKRITAKNIGKSLAIVLDNRVYSAPNVGAAISNGISEITGSFSVSEAKDLANILKAGSLPAPVKIVEDTLIGPTLGEEAQLQGILSMLFGLVLVIIFMVFYYARAGIVANAALLFNMLFIFGVLAQLHASLTLPGIAGIVLTIGMSIDANVLIFERIREELKRGIMIKSAIATGYNKAYSSIIDSNVTTFLTGAILYLLGQGPIKGFATTLMIGIISSFFSAVFITRVIILFMLGKDKNAKMGFSFPFTSNLLTNVNFDFLKNRKRSYLVSILFVALGVGLVAHQKGLNLGVDFKGGRSYVVAFGQPVAASVLKTKLAESFENTGTEVKTYGANNKLEVTTSYLVNDDSEEGDDTVRKALIKGISDHTGFKEVKSSKRMKGNTFTILRSSKIGPTIAGDIKNSAKSSVLLSLLMIFLYILLRFRRLQFGLAAVVALFHDTLTVVAAFAIARAFGFVFEIDQVFIAAILTVIGYSINDTVVVFDRVRERLREFPNEDFSTTSNKAINDTISRTLITSFTTFIAVFVLFVFGGEVLRGFSFALLIGIIFGTYSSVFIATPLVIDLSKNLLSGKKKQ